MIRPANAADFPALLALNLASEHFLSPLDRTRLEWLHDMSSFHQVVESEGAITAFLLAIREGTEYDSLNYRWFAERYPRFLYIDRIVVDAAHRAEGLGAQLYAALFVTATADGVEIITCEFDLDPPNEASRRFHESFGFTEVGRQWVGEGKKEVSLQQAMVRDGVVQRLATLAC